MIITHFNRLLDGGAATAARRLHASLIELGITSRFYHSDRAASGGGDQDDALGEGYYSARWQSADWRERITRAIDYRLHRQRFKRALRQQAPGQEIFTSPRAPQSTPWPPLDHPAAEGGESWRFGIIHLHWIAKLLDYETFFPSLDERQAIVWTLHDMNPFTGGCHFSAGCEGFETGCGACPELRSCALQDVSRQAHARKAAAIRGTNLHVVAPSRWLLDQAQSSSMFQAAKSFTHLPYGISTTDYRPMDRGEARHRLGLDPDAFVLCFGAMDVKSVRKGAAELVQALAAIADLPGVQGLVFGSGCLPTTTSPLPPIHEVGPVGGLLEQRTVYCASDVFVLPSLEDNLPLTGLEAMACGLPIVGFDAGGIPDYVRPQQTGLLAATGDWQQLAQHLRSLIQAPGLTRAMGRRARKLIELEYSSHREATAYQRLYASLLESRMGIKRAA